MIVIIVLFPIRTPVCIVVLIAIAIVPSEAIKIEQDMLGRYKFNYGNFVSSTTVRLKTKLVFP